VTGRTQAVLEVNNIAVHYGGIKAVNGISFSLEPGRISGILGPNGSGKTTLLGALTRMVSLTSGRLVFLGQDYSKVPARKILSLGIARTFQTVRVLPDRTVLDNILLGTDALSSSRAGNVKENVRQAIERTGLEGFEQVRPGALSYGVQRRVEIARAIAAQPSLLLLDEPTAGMNQHERQEIGTLLRKLSEEGLTQLLIEHDVQMMLDTCDKLFAMNFGVLIAEGTPESVVQSIAVQESYLGKRVQQNA
jgi:ABC-type branched-subunit amino acid transport system ATPase component